MYTRQQSGTAKVLLQPKPDGDNEKNETFGNGNTVTATETALPVTEQTETNDGNALNVKTEKRKTQYKARRPIRSLPSTEMAVVTDIKSTDEDKIGEISDEKERNTEATCDGVTQTEKTERRQVAEERGLDELLILAILVLLVMQGSDDISVLALCYVLL